MKSCKATTLGLVFFVSTLFASARDIALQYKFSAGQTNAFAVEISVRSENGSETNSGNVILVTKEANSNSVTLICRGNFKSEMSRMPSQPGLYRSFYPGMMRTVNLFPYECEIEFDLRGNEIRDGGDYVLAVPLGKLVESLFAPLPARLGNSEWKDSVRVLDDPFWLGPADNFLSLRQDGQPMSMGYINYLNGQRNPPATLSVLRQTTCQIKDSTSKEMVLHQHSTLESAAQLGGEPRLEATSDSDLNFNRELGLMSHVETQADVSSQSETSSRHAKITFKSRLLSGSELAAALAPIPQPVSMHPSTPPPSRTISGAELDKLIADLKSPERETRRAAVRQLFGRDIDSPSAEVIQQVGALTSDSDSFVCMAANTFIGNHATTNEVPLLLKSLKSSDRTVRQSAIKALGRLKDPRAIQPLCDLLARNGISSSPDISSTLINFGPPGENAVLGLLNEHNADTQR